MGPGLLRGSIHHMSNPLENLIADMTLADLARMSGKSVSELAAYILSGSTSTPKARAPKAKSNGAAPTATQANGAKRTAEATDALGEAIIVALEKADAPMSSEALAAIVGGTSATRRYAIAKLGKKIKSTGRARGVRYSLR